MVGEQVAGGGRRRADVAGTVASITGGVAYLVAKGGRGEGDPGSASRWPSTTTDCSTSTGATRRCGSAIFVGRDFAYYWIHRAEHEVRVLWASHQVHHSLERFTFTSAVRLPWMESLYKPVLALWVPLLGFPPAAFAGMGALVLLVGQLQHTELLPPPVGARPRRS